MKQQQIYNWFNGIYYFVYRFEYITNFHLEFFLIIYLFHFSYSSSESSDAERKISSGKIHKKYYYHNYCLL